MSIAIFPVCGTCAGLRESVRNEEPSCAERVRKRAGTCEPVGARAKDARFGVIPMCGTCAEVCANVRPMRAPCGSGVDRGVSCVWNMCGIVRNRADHSVPAFGACADACGNERATATRVGRACVSRGVPVCGTCAKVCGRVRPKVFVRVRCAPHLAFGTSAMPDFTHEARKLNLGVSRKIPSGSKT